MFEFDDLKARDLKKNSKYILLDITLLQDGLSSGNFCTNKSTCDVWISKFEIISYPNHFKSIYLIKVKNYTYKKIKSKK